MLTVHVDPAWSVVFPGARMGLLEARGLPSLPTHPALEARRGQLEAELRGRHGGTDRKGLRELPVMRAFEAHYRPQGKTYHVLAQLESVACKGRTIPSRLCAVTAMFMAELEHGLVAAGHDLDLLAPPLRLAPSRGGERYVNLGGAQATLPADDMTLAHGRGIISSVLLGPDRETPIGPDTRNALYTIYAPAGLPEGALEGELDALAGYLALFAPDVLLERLIQCFDEAPRPFMLKCSGGQDRTSLAAALYLIHGRGWQAFDLASAQYARFPYLHFPKQRQRWLRPFLDFAREETRGAPLAEWITAGYAPEKLVSWLAARGLADSHGGIFSTPTRSPYQW